MSFYLHKINYIKWIKQTRRQTYNHIFLHANDIYTRRSADWDLFSKNKEWKSNHNIRYLCGGINRKMWQMNCITYFVHSRWKVIMVISCRKCIISQHKHIKNIKPCIVRWIIETNISMDIYEMPSILFRDITLLCYWNLISIQYLHWNVLLHHVRNYFLAHKMLRYGFWKLL